MCPHGSGRVALAARVQRHETRSTQKPEEKMATYPRAGASEVPAQPDFPELEQRALAYWNAHDTFKASVKNRDSDSEFVFYDGPPFANGLPHYGHLLTGYVKDIVPRYKTMRGEQGGQKVRLGLPRPARRGRGRTTARHLRQGRHPRDGHRDLQRGLPRLRAPLHQGVGGVRHQAGPLGRLRQRLQDARPPLHGERHVGVQAAARQGPDLPGLQGAALLLAVRDPAVQPRAADGRRRLHRPDGPVASPCGSSWRPASGSSPGPPRPGRCRRTWPSRSARTSRT